MLLWIWMISRCFYVLLLLLALTTKSHVHEFQKVISEEPKRQILEKEGRLLGLKCQLSSVFGGIQCHYGAFLPICKVMRVVPARKKVEAAGHGQTHQHAK